MRAFIQRVYTRAEKPEVTQDHVTYVTTVQCSVERDFETAKSSLYEIIETDAATTPAYSNEVMRRRTCMDLSRQRHRDPRF